MYPRVLAAARRLTRSPAAADDLVQTVFVLIARRKRRWDPALVPDPERFVLDVLGSVWSNERTRATSRAEARFLHGVEDDLAPSSDVSPEALAIGKEAQMTHADTMQRVLERLAGDPVALGVIRLSDEDVTSRAEQAGRLGVTIEQIKAARQRIDYAIAAAVAEHEKAERRRRVR
jgi:DNA-directed RNA polymerase specialized sigma24 family protein